MNVIVVGAGHMGRGLARRLDRQGHDVTVVDRDAEELEELGEDFSGTRVLGVGFDRAVLAEAGVDRASAVIACTSSDEANIVIARVARGTYRVPRVIARLYDISKAEAYRRLASATPASCSPTRRWTPSTRSGPGACSSCAPTCRRCWRAARSAR